MLLLLLPRLAFAVLLRSRGSRRFLLDCSHGCAVVPVEEVPPWWVFRHSFHQGPRAIHVSRARQPLMHRTSVIGELVPGVGLPSRGGVSRA